MNEQWLRRYRVSLRFAAFYDSDHMFDIVHDAYLYYMQKTGDDLFDLDLKDESSYLYTVIKRAFFRWYRRERRGESYKYLPTEVLESSHDDPEDTLIGKDLYEIFYKKLALNYPIDEKLKNAKDFISQIPNFDRLKRRTDKNGIHKWFEKYRDMYPDGYNFKEWIASNDIEEVSPINVFKLKIDGYSQKEIAEKLNLSRQTIRSYSKKIEDMAEYNNPFAGSRVVVKKRISETLWEKRTDKEEFELEDENEMIRLYVHKESGEGWIVTNKNPKGSEHYIKKMVDGK